MSLPILFAALTLGASEAEAAPTGPWRIERVDSRCTLSWRGSGPKPLLLTLDTTPGSGLIRLVAADPGWGDQAAAKAAAMPFILDPGGPVAGEKERPISSVAGGSVELAGVDRSFLAAFAKARSIRLEKKGKTPFRLDLPAAAAGVGAFRDCEERSLSEWGVDAAAHGALGRLPKAAGAGAVEWFRWQEYPDGAGVSGTVVARITVSPAGSPVECAVVVGAGHPALDKLTCDSVLKRARFEPGLDSSGRSVRSDYILRTVWRAP
jgi:TonB family protein